MGAALCFLVPASTIAVLGTSGFEVRSLEQILRVAQDPSRAKEASRYFQEAIQFAADELPEKLEGLRQNYAVFLFKNNQLNKAAKVLEAVLSANPAARQAQTMLADLYVRGGHHKRGVRLLAKSLRQGDSGLCSRHSAWALQALEGGNIPTSAAHDCAVRADTSGAHADAEAMMRTAIMRLGPSELVEPLLKTLDVIQHGRHELDPNAGHLENLIQTRARRRALGDDETAVAWRSARLPQSFPRSSVRKPAFDGYKPCRTVHVDNLDSEKFMHFVRGNEAVLVQGLRTWPAESWSLERLQALFGDLVVQVDLLHPGARTNRLEELDGPWTKILRDLDQEAAASAHPLVHVRPTKTHMFASDVLAALQGWLPSHVRPYLNQQDVNTSYPHLASEVAGVPAFARGIESRLVWRNLWFGGAADTPLHFDGKDNLLAVLNGTKEVLLLPPTAYDEFEGAGRLHDVFPESVATTQQVQEFVAGETNRHWSQARLDNVHLPVNHTHPQGRLGKKFKKWSTKHGCVSKLRRGSALFIPIFWSHAVLSNPDPEEVAVTALNYWFLTGLQLEQAVALAQARD